MQNVRLAVPPAKSTFSITGAVLSVVGIGMMLTGRGSFDGMLNIIEKPFGKDTKKKFHSTLQKLSSISGSYKDAVKAKIEEARVRIEWLYQTTQNYDASDAIALGEIEELYKTFSAMGVEDIDYKDLIDQLDELAKSAKLDEMVF